MRRKNWIIWEAGTGKTLLIMELINNIVKTHGGVSVCGGVVNVLVKEMT